MFRGPAADAKQSRDTAAGLRLGDMDPPQTAIRVLPSRLTPPIHRGGIVQRRALVDRLLQASDKTMVAVVAPAGYGKSTLLAQWAAQDPRRFAWLSFEPSFNDPAVLLTYLAVSIADVINVEPEVFDGLVAPHPSERAAVVAGVASSVSRAAEHFVLVLDDVHRLVDPEGIAMLERIVEHLAEGSQLALAAQQDPPLARARMRSEGRLLDLGQQDLRFNASEARLLLASMGADLGKAEIAGLVSRTDGWPVALYFAGLASRAAELPELRPGQFAGDDRLLADYIRSEFLARVPADELLFLTRTSVLDEFSGPLCDAVLGQSGSAAILEEMEGSNLLLIPLDRQQRWYRYVKVFQEMLRHELDRAHPDAARGLVLRASDWCLENGLLDSAIEYTQAAPDMDRVGNILLRHGMRLYANGRAAALRNWMDWLTERDPLNGGIAVQGAWLSVLSGRSAEADRLAAIADQAPQDVTLPDGSPLTGWVSTLHAAMALDVEQMRTDAERAMHLLAPSSQWRPTALSLLGSAELFRGDVDTADVHLADSVELAPRLGGPAAGSVSLATRAIISIGRGRWGEAESFLEQSLSVIRQAHLASYSTSGLTFAVKARAAMNVGDARTARKNVESAEQLLPLLTRAFAHLAIETRLQLIRACVALGDVGAAAARLLEVDHMLRSGREFGLLREEAEELSAQIEEIRTSAPNGLGLTPAELRLLPLLATQLSFREIAEQIFVSIHTVKAQVTLDLQEAQCGLAYPSHRASTEPRSAARLTTRSPPPDSRACQGFSSIRVMRSEPLRCWLDPTNGWRVGIMGETRLGNKSLETVLRTDELYGHDGLWLGPRGRDYGVMLPNPKPYQHANLYPDPNATYWFAIMEMPAGSVLTLRGRYPHGRYMQFRCIDPTPLAGSPPPGRRSSTTRSSLTPATRTRSFPARTDARRTRTKRSRSPTSIRRPTPLNGHRTPSTRARAPRSRSCTACTSPTPDTTGTPVSACPPTRRRSPMAPSYRRRRFGPSSTARC
jgi:LuxR family maltose regulon positive regulatory protein